MLLSRGSCTRGYIAIFKTKETYLWKELSVRMESRDGSTSGASEISKPPQYNVFINHRGRDVKNTFVAHLYAALLRDEFRPFLDAIDIGQARHVFKSIKEALEGASVHVAIFSRGYAESEHCLNELCDMLESGKEILPVFYHVDPENLRRIEAGPFNEGFRKHSERPERQVQVVKWKDALFKISNFRGLRLDEVNGNEEQLIRRILDEVRRLMSVDVLPGLTVHRGAQLGTPVTEGPENNGAVTFESGDRRLNILVLGDSKLVKDFCGHICGAGTPHTPVKDHVNLTESRNSWPPMCLYGDTMEIYKHDFSYIKTFVKGRNEKWHQSKVEPLWFDEVYHREERPALSAVSIKSRLHMLWFVCRKISDLPDGFKWSEITKKLYDLPVQILVTGMQRSHDLDSHYIKILEDGSRFFRNAQNVEELIVKVALPDGEVKENLWRKCWAAKTRAEIGNAAKIIRVIREELGSSGISVNVGVGGARISKEVSLLQSADFVLHFLCTYWDVPQDKMHDVLRRVTTFEQARGNTYKIKPCEFVKFCLVVAAMILYNARDNAGSPKHVCNWDVSSESSCGQLLLTEAQECYDSYFGSSIDLSYYHKMEFVEIRMFLQSIFERKGWALRPVGSVGKSSFASRLLKLIFRSRNGVVPSNLETNGGP